MATPSSVLISPEEYLRTSYEGPDREFVDGEVIERSMPTTPHSRIQGQFSVLLARQVLGSELQVMPELRLAIEPLHLYRIPDVSIYPGSVTLELVPAIPPLVAIEIASPDDKLADTLDKFDEYLAWGVEHIWLVHPNKKKLYTFDSTGLRPVSILSLPAYAVHVTLADLGLA